MRTISFIHIFYIYFLHYYSSNSEGWGYVNLHCRDNENAPVDWWYIYKPPSDALPFFHFGRNFSFITPKSTGRWEPSDTYITSNSMLHHTLSPIFRSTYTDYLAVAIYDEAPGSASRGVLMADEMGGVWIDHTVPGLVNMDNPHSSFPEKESAYGHLLMCLSLDLENVNLIAYYLGEMYPKLTYLKIPNRLRRLLPGWNLIGLPLRSNKIIKSHQLVTRGDSIRVHVLMRPPGNTNSVYENFARSKHIVLDVYRQRNQICRKTFSVRNIQSLSLKYSEQVYYINNQTDKIHFAVSTAAHWQALGSGPRQYWTCISNLDSKVSLGLAGDLVCVEDYKIWLAFDNMKVKEPEC